MTEPLVSVLMTAYNREKYIAEAIESVLASSHTNFELIIVDDGSSDSTVNIAKRYEAKDNRIKVYINEKNLGDYFNRNKAASYAQGKYLKYLDSDDMIYPWGLEAMVMCMEKFPEAGYGLMSYGLPQPAIYPILVPPEKAFKYFYFKFALITMGPSGAIFTREAFNSVNGFSGKPYVGDGEMWIKMGSKFSMVRMPLDLIWWRQHEGQQIKEGTENNYYFDNQYSVYTSGLLNSDCPLPQRERNMALRNLKSVRIRSIITKYLLHLKFRKAFLQFKKDHFNIADLFKAFKRNKYNVDF